MAQPEVVKVIAGKKAFCTCGLSKNKPYCDGSHSGTDKKPMIQTVAEDTEMFICSCGKSKNTPFCDGSHLPPFTA